MDHKKLAKAVTLFAVTLLLLTSALDIRAWLKNSQEQRFQLAADALPDISLYTAVWDSGAKQYVWSAPAPMNTGRTVTQAFGTAITGSLPTPEFGTIDNLAADSLDNSNYMWFCLKIHETEGRSFSGLRLNYAQEPFVLWQTDSKTTVRKVTGYSAGALDLSKLMYVLKPADETKFISAQAPQNFGTAQVTIPQNPEFVKPSTTASGGFGGTATAVDQDGYYYVYFRVSPNLGNYYGLVDGLYQYMPCYLEFKDLEISIQVDTPAPAAQP